MHLNIILQQQRSINTQQLKELVSSFSLHQTLIIFFILLPQLYIYVLWNLTT